jgi:ribosomal protein S6
VRNLLHELKLIETDLFYEINDEQKAYYMLIALSPNLSKDMINKTKSKITFKNQIATII